MAAKIQRTLGKAAACGVALAAFTAGCAPVREASAAPASVDKPEALPLAPPPRVVPETPARAALPDGEVTRAELESSNHEVEDVLTQLTAALADFESERRTWTAMDRSMAAARAMNLAIGKRNKAVVTLYDDRVADALERFKVKLKAAPSVYRRLAAERRGYQAGATLELEIRSYRAMAELCEAAALACERRYEELFGKPAGGGLARKNATTLAETIENMRTLSVVHDRWEETFAAYPSTLDDGKLSTLFEHLSAYAEDMEAFTKGVESLKDAMRKKVAAEDKPKEAPKPLPPPPQANPERVVADTPADTANVQAVTPQAPAASIAVQAPVVREVSNYTVYYPNGRRVVYVRAR